MEVSDKLKSFGPTLSRRQVLGTASAAGALAAMPWTGLEAQVEELKKEGWEPHPIGCNVCGGACGMLAMHKKGAPVSKETVRMMPNPNHPQRGFCARGASSMWVWNHPLRLKKPMKRVGKRGEGKFEEISWDQALNEIAARVKGIVEKDGERSIVLTSHNFSGFQKWFAAGLGTPNVISHSSTCNSGTIMGRRTVFGKGFDGAGKMDPDYGNCRFLLLNGRSLNCAIGIAGVAARAREQGARLVFVDPRMPEGAFAGAEWIPIKPGTDAAFHLGLIHIALKEGLVDIDFLTRHTNAGYLIGQDGKPVTEAMIREDGSKTMFAVIDAATKELAFRGPKLDEKGAAVGFIEDGLPELEFQGTIKDKDGNDIAVKTCLVAMKEHVSQYTPEEVAKITHIPAKRLQLLARQFFTQGGVVDDGWYGSRNGNDSQTFQILNLLNVLAGNIDKKGGLVVTAGAGFKSPGASFGGGKGSGPQGQKWTVEGAEKKALDKVIYPEGAGTFSAVFEAIHTGKPYPVRGVFVTGSTMFHREANSARLAKAFEALDLLVVQDILPHEVIDYADYVLPSTYFMEWYDYGNVKWSIDGDVHKFDAAIVPPADCEARHEIWQFCEILRRCYPERAAERLGYDKEMKTAEEFNAWHRGMIDKAWDKYIAKLNVDKPGLGDRVAKEVAEQGWSKVKTKKYEVYPYQKPFGTPTGKCEIYSFYVAEKYMDKLPPLPGYVQAPAYKAPKPNSDEFVLVSGKDSAASSGTSFWTKPQQWLGDRRVWINPVDAERLGFKDGDEVELTGLDTGVKGRTHLKVTNRVIPGALFSLGFQGGCRTKFPFKAPGYEWVRQGINSHWFCTGYREPVVGVVSNNCSVRIKRV